MDEKKSIKIPPPLNPFLIMQRFHEGLITPGETTQLLEIWNKQASGVREKAEDEFLEAQGWIRIEKAIDQVSGGLLEEWAFDSSQESYQTLRRSVVEALVPEEDWDKYL
jgi:hypothetical protein